MQAFTWDTIPEEQLTPLLRRKVVHTETMTLALLHMHAGAVVGRHQHVNEQVSTIVSGSLEFTFDDHVVLLRAGEVLVIPPNVPHAARAVEDCVATDLFSPRREDWIRGELGYFFQEAK